MVKYFTFVFSVVPPLIEQDASIIPPLMPNMLLGLLCHSFHIVVHYVTIALFLVNVAKFLMAGTI